MGIQKTQYQGGSIVSFVIVTVLLAAVLVGGVIWLRQRGDIARQSDQAETSSQEESTTEEQGNDSDSGNSESDNSDSSDGDQKSTPTELPGAASSEDQDDDNGVAVGSTDDNDSDNASGGSGTTVPGHLPETGPAEVVVAALAAVALVYSGVRYIQSRRDLTQAVSEIV